MELKKQEAIDTLYSDVRQIIESARSNAVRSVDFCRVQFYRTYPMAHTLYAQLNWSQYKLLISIDDPDKREYYELESVSNACQRGKKTC